jgi:acyl-CoA thioesterase FadM
MTVRSTDINVGNHLGNDSLISMISDARTLFLSECGIAMQGVANRGAGMIVTDLATIYKAEARYRDELLFQIGVMDFNTYGGDIFYHITRPADGAVIALAKNGFVFFDYLTSKVQAMPEDFRARFPHA